MRKLIDDNEIKILENLPDLAKGLAVTYMYDYCPEMRWAIRESVECESPIEVILLIAIEIMRNVREEDFVQTPHQDGFHEGYVIDVSPQFEVEANGKNYRLDFLVYAWHTNGNKELYLDVECDGHDFHHATKEQVQHDNEREYDLKMEGIDVLRFSGTQIFTEPTKCANDILNYIKMKVEPDEE